MADRKRSTASRIILDLGTVSYIDAIGIRALEQLASDLKVKAIEIMLAQCKGIPNFWWKFAAFIESLQEKSYFDMAGPLLKQLKELEIHKIIPGRNIFPSVVDAVDESLRRIKINTGPTEGLIGEYEDDRFWDMPVIPVEGLPVIDYDMD
jgi:MFS superfamily sulfate permease-like transporter